LLNALAGQDERDATSIARPAEDFTRYLGCRWRGEARDHGVKPLAGLRIGLPGEFQGKGIEPAVSAAVEAALRTYEYLGAERVDVSLPYTQWAIPTYYIIAPAEASSNLARFDGVRYGYRTPLQGDLVHMYKKTRAEGFGAEVKRRILVGTYVLSQNSYRAYYLKAQKVRRLIAQDFQRAFEQCDVLMGPVSPVVAWDRGVKIDEADHVEQLYLADVYTLSASLAGLPGMSVPCGFSQTGRPVGLQVIANYFDEARLLQVAHAFQQATDWHCRIPEQFA